MLYPVEKLEKANCCYWCMCSINKGDFRNVKLWCFKKEIGVYKYTVCESFTPTKE